MPKKKESTVNDQSFWICRTCCQEVSYREGLWRSTGELLKTDWICPDKIDAVSYGVVSFSDIEITLRPGYKDYYHDGQEVDPAADLLRIISEL